MDDLVDWIAVKAYGIALRFYDGEEPDDDGESMRNLTYECAGAFREGYAAGLADGAPKTCETCRRWKRAEYCTLNPEPLRVRTYCDRDYLTRAPGEFCSDHDPRKP